MTRKFVKGEMVKIEKTIVKRNRFYKNLIGKYARITYVTYIHNWTSSSFFVKFLDTNKTRLVYKNEISHVSKKIQEEVLAKELAEKL